MANVIKTSRFFKYISSFMAFILWGGWAFFINFKDSINTGVISGLTQGTASFMITLFLVHAVTWLYQKFKYPVLKLLLPAIITVSFTSSCLLFIHYLVGTPHILLTILPAISIAFIFCLFTSYKLHKINHHLGTKYE